MSNFAVAKTKNNKFFNYMINAQDIKNGTCIRMDGKLYFCIEFLHVKPGKGNTFMRTKLKDVVNGYVIERRFNIGEKLEDVRVERRPPLSRRWRLHFHESGKLRPNSYPQRCYQRC